jgi:serine phosphatase RsbU (regulator of sigma subunit)
LKPSVDSTLVRSVPLFAALPAAEIAWLAEALILTEAPAGAIVFTEGDVADRFSVLLASQVEIVQALGSREERILSVLEPGHFMGEMSLLYHGGRRSASVRSRTYVRLLELTRDDFETLLKREPGLAMEILRTLIDRLRSSENLTIRDLQEKNRQLAQAYQELKEAQGQLIEKEKMEHELRMARRIQESILPKRVPALPGWSLAAYWQPAREVSGDFYDFFSFADGRLGIFTGDVTDKGVPAALVMATTRAVLRTVAEQCIEPGAVLSRVNDILLADMPKNMFVTCLYAILDPGSGIFRVANAGHNVPYQCTSRGILDVRATGMPLGLMPGMSYLEVETCLASGDSLLLFSDGLVEAHNPGGELFGFPRLKQLYAARPREADCIQYLVDQLASFTQPGWEQEDDITLVTIERK